MRLREMLKEYIQETIQTKKGMRRRIYQLEQERNEARANEKYATEQKEKYKQANKRLRKKLNEKKER